MNILVAGMGSCGSTLLCNLVKFCYENNNQTIQISLAHSYIPITTDNILLKTHDFSKELLDWADIILTARRDLRDAVVSNKRRFPGLFLTEEDFLFKTNEEIVSHQDWVLYSNYEFVYEDYFSDGARIVSELADTLHLTVDNPDTILNKAEELKRVTDFGHNSKNLLMSSEHIGDGKIGKYKELLTDREQELINSRYGWWLERYGYTCTQN